MKKVVNLLGHGLFYTLAISIESIAPFILAPFLTHYLTVYDYGIWALFQGACAFLRPTLGLALDDYVRMRYHQHPKDRMMGCLIAIIALSGVLSLAAYIMALLCAGPLSNILHFPENWFWSIILCSWLYGMFYALLAYYQFESRKIHFAVIHFTQAICTLGISVFLVMNGHGWQGAVLGKIVGLAMGCLLAWLWIVRHFPKSALSYFNMSLLPDIISFGWRYLPNGIVFVVVVLTNRLLLANMVNVEASSLFSVASLFPMVLMITIQGYIFGWQPWCFSHLAQKNHAHFPELFAGCALFFIGLPIGGFILSWGANWLGPYVIDAQFNEAFTYVFPLTMAMVAQGFYYFTQSILQFYQRLGLLSAIAAITMATNLALNFILIERAGTVGSCWATALAYAIAFLLTAIASIITLRKEYNISPTKESPRV